MFKHKVIQKDGKKRKIGILQTENTQQYGKFKINYTNNYIKCQCSNTPNKRHNVSVGYKCNAWLVVYKKPSLNIKTQVS